MMRVVGRVGLVAVAVALYATSSAQASALSRANAVGLNAIPGVDGISARNFTGTGFEASEGFTLGTISNNNGWHCLGASTAFPPGPRCPGDGTDGIVAKGNGSLQSAFISQNFNYPGGTLTGFRPPRIKNETPQILQWDMRVDDNFGSNYYVGPQHIYSAPTGVPGRVVFGYSGYLYMLDVIGGTQAFYQPAAHPTFPIDTWFTFQMVMDYANHTIGYYIGPDKNNLALVYQSTDFGSNAVYAIDDMIFASDQYQNTGFGPISGNTAGAYIDNFYLKPEPGTFAMLAAGVLLVVRRRR